MTTAEYHQNIRKVWVLANDNSSSLTDTGPLVGDGSFELIFVTGSGYRVWHDGVESSCPPGIYLGGQLDKPLSIEVLPGTRLNFFKLEPWAASLLFNFNFKHSLNQTIPVKEFNPVLYSKLSNLDWDEDHDGIRSLLLRTFEEQLHKHPHFNLIRYGCQLLAHNYFDFGAAKEDLIERSGLSSRSVEQKLSQSIGLTPKKFSNMIRIRKVSEEIYHAKDAFALTDLALKHGYYDQAHFIRDCRKYLDLSPKQISPEQCFITDSNESFRFYTI